MASAAGLNETMSVTVIAAICEVVSAAAWSVDRAATSEVEREAICEVVRTETCVGDRLDMIEVMTYPFLNLLFLAGVFTTLVHHNRIRIRYNSYRFPIELNGTTVEDFSNYS